MGPPNCCPVNLLVLCQHCTAESVRFISAMLSSMICPSCSAGALNTVQGPGLLSVQPSSSRRENPVYFENKFLVILGPLQNQSQDFDKLAKSAIQEPLEIRINSP